MKVLFSNPPWWDGRQSVTAANGEQLDLYVAGVRAGSRWPFTMTLRNPPDQFAYGAYLPYPFFLGYAATYAAKLAGADIVFRDSIALRESYTTYMAFVLAGRFDYIVIESASPSWQHDEALIRLLHRSLPRLRIVVTGPIASKGEQLLRALPIHACIRGEYEKGVVRILRGESGMIDFDMLSLEEMNAAPFPYYDALHAHRYLDTNPRGNAAGASVEQPRLPVQMHLLRLAGDNDRQRPRRDTQANGAPLQRRLHGSLPERAGRQIWLSVDLF
jgi:hypothetical protein